MKLFRQLSAFACLGAALLTGASALASGTWTKTYDNNAVEDISMTFKAMTHDASGNVFVTGYALVAGGYDMYTAKYAATTGALLWERRYKAPANLYDATNAIAVDASGNVFVTGYSYNAGWNADIYTAKYAAANGALLWEKRYNGPGNSTDTANAIAVDASGNVIVTGSSIGVGSLDIYTAKYAAANGALLWENRQEVGGVAKALILDAGGNVLITGYTNGLSGKYDIYTAKYAATTGLLLWERRYNGPRNVDDSSVDDMANAIAVDTSGNAIITGYSNHQDSNLYNTDIYTAKYASADGALVWEKRYNDPVNSTDTANAVAVDSSGNVFVTGSSVDASYNHDLYTAKYAAADGTLLWEKRYIGADGRSTKANDVVVDANGDALITGIAYSVGQDGDFYTARYAATTGDILWEKQYNGPANQDDEAIAITMDASGHVCVAGSSQNATNYYNIQTIKYDAVTGAAIWEERSLTYGSGNDTPSAMAIDANGNAVVTGASQGANAKPDYYTAKYAAATGALLWEKRYNGPANIYDAANAIALNASGDVFVTGRSDGNGSSSDIYTAKYASGTGALLWEKRYNGPLTAEDTANAIAVDASGDVIITGYSATSAGGFYDIYTAKYSGATGAVLWEKKYSGAGIGYDLANALAIDASGNVVITGYSTAPFIGTEIYTAKYAGATGELLWEQKYSGSFISYNTGNAIALDASGNVVIAGVGAGPDGVFGIYTAKYAGISGALLWEKKLAGTGYNREAAKAVAVDAGGNVIVAGDIYGASENYDIYIAKYAADSGATLWEKSYNGPANKDDKVSSIAVDSIGRVFITGYSTDANNVKGIYTAGYAGINGGLLGENLYINEVRASSFGVALKLDSSANIFVTGGSFGDYLTRKIPPVAATRVIELSGYLAFGKVNVGSTKTLNLTINNTGNSALTVISVTCPKDFSGNWSGAIPAGGSQVVPVTFAPTQKKSYSNYLTVNCDKTSGTNTKAVSGTGK